MAAFLTVPWSRIPFGLWALPFPPFQAPASDWRFGLPMVAGFDPSGQHGDSDSRCLLGLNPRGDASLTPVRTYRARAPRALIISALSG